VRLLLLGGTRFLGRHVAEEALARGHEVTLFSRGRTPQPFGDRVGAVVGDRDPRVSPGLAALEQGAWDAAIDTSGYVPRVVGASANLLARRVHRYVFVSSLSVIARPDRPGLDESAPVATLDDPATEDVLPNYGALKAACEAVVRAAYGDRATIVRPGLIVGPHDATDRFGYWVARFVHPHLLGDRPPRAVVPAPRERPVQFVDARDLAAWLLDLCERDIGGTYNACSPAGLWTMGDLVDACVAASADPPVSAWVDEKTLLDFHVEPWTGLPLWIPSTDADSAGFMGVDCDRAHAVGLFTRPLDETVRDTAAWLAARENAGAWQHVLSASREQLLLSAIDAR
jgi:2'-hydroxyisoflavone reductase